MVVVVVVVVVVVEVVVVVVVVVTNDFVNQMYNTPYLCNVINSYLLLSVVSNHCRFRFDAVFIK